MGPATVGGFHLEFVRISKILVIDVFCMGFPRPMFRLAVLNKGASAFSGHEKIHKIHISARLFAAM